MGWTCLEEKTVTARKEHICFFCGEPIEKGERYDSRTGVDDSFCTMAMHPECNRATASWDQDDYECFSEGSMQRGKDQDKEPPCVTF